MATGHRQHRVLSLLPTGLLTSFILHLYGTNEDMSARRFAASTMDKCIRRDAQGACKGEHGGDGALAPQPGSPTFPPQIVAAPCSPTSTPASPTVPHATTARAQPPQTQPVCVPAATPPATHARGHLPTTARPVPLPARSMSSHVPAPLLQACPPSRGCRATCSLSSSAAAWSSQPSSMARTVWPFAL